MRSKFQLKLVDDVILRLVYPVTNILERDGKKERNYWTTPIETMQILINVYGFSRTGVFKLWYAEGC